MNALAGFVCAVIGWHAGFAFGASLGFSAARLVAWNLGESPDFAMNFVALVLSGGGAGSVISMVVFGLIGWGKLNSESWRVNRFVVLAVVLLLMVLVVQIQLQLLGV